MANQTSNLGLPLTLHGHVAMAQALTAAFKTLDSTLGGAGAFLGKSGVTPNLGLPLNFQGPGTMAESVRTAFKILDARIGGAGAFAAVPWATPNLGLSMILQGHVALRIAVADAFKKLDTAAGGVITIMSAPSITTPLIVGTPAAFTPAVFSDGQPPTATQYTVAGTDSGASYTPNLANSAKQIRVRQASSAGSPIATSPPALVGWRNWKASNTVKIRQLMAGGVRGRVLFLGDSYPAGYGSDPGGAGGARNLGFVAQAVPLLTSGGVPSSYRNYVGTGMAQTEATTQTPTTVTGNDARITWVGGSVLAGPYQAIGGRLMGMINTTSRLIFTPGGTFDTIDVVVANNPSYGAFGIGPDDAAYQSVADNGPLGYGKATITVAPGSTQVWVKRLAGATGYIQSINCRNAATPQVEVMNAAMSGGFLATLATPTDQSSINAETWNTRAAIPVILDPTQPNVVFLNGWYNDRSRNGSTISDLQTAMGTLVNAIKALGHDVVWLNYSSIATANITLANFRAYADGLMDYAINTLDIPVFDISRAITTYEDNTGLYFDTLHLNGPGAAYPAASIAGRLLAPLT